LNHFDVFKAVPLDGSATYEEIAIRTGIPVDIARRYLRYAFTLRIFEERDGRVHHTAASAEGATSKYLKSWVRALTPMG
jgi:transcription initiation factor IIE alpha subunit